MTPDLPAKQPSLRAPFLRLARINQPNNIPFHAFVRDAWKITEPAKPFMDNWHIGYICEHLVAVSQGQIKKLLINIPPRWAKSTLVTIDWPCWEWGPLSKPELRYMFISYDQGLSTDHSLARRAILESEWYKQQWPGVRISSDQNQKTFIQNTRRGKMIATSTHGGATGKGGDRLIFDDFINPKMAESEAERISAIRQYGQTFSSRLDDKTRGAMVCVEQRIHAQDFTAKLIEEGGWTHIVIPVDNYTPKALHYSFPLTKHRELEVIPGAPIWPEREPVDVIAETRRRMGSRAHDAQARQIPSSAEGTIFKRSKWRFYDEMPRHLDSTSGKWVLTEFDDMLQSWDCTFKDESTSDYVVGQVWGRTGADRYLLDQTRERLTMPGTIEAILSLTQKWRRASRILIEDKANGPAVIQMLERKLPGLIAVNPEGGKIVRARAVEPIQESGNIFLPSPRIAPWISDFIERASLFPNVDYDDEIDAFTQANIYFTSDDIPRLTII